MQIMQQLICTLGPLLGIGRLEAQLTLDKKLSIIKRKPSPLLVTFGLGARCT